ncbi:MAG TPA: hypothetical protein VGP72_22230 [Planctomycetota bacterium]|jgi:hypothetical protein
MNKHLLNAALVSLSLTLLSVAYAGQPEGENLNETFGYTAGPSRDFLAQQIGCSVPANVLYPKEQAEFIFQVVNQTAQPIKANGTAELLSYRTSQYPDDSFRRRFIKGEKLGTYPFSVELAAKGTAQVTIKPSVPETFGPYALVLEIEGHGRSAPTPLVRVPAAVSTGRIQFPAFALDICGWNNYPETFMLFKRIGIKAIRQEIGFEPSENTKKRLAETMKGLWDHEITLLITSAAGGPQPHKETNVRRYLNDKDELVTNPQQGDMCPVPAADESFQEWIKYLAGNYGWPKGPVNAIELWNEPWEGISISGWGADCLRYRDLFARMAQGIEEARKESAVQVLIGGCCSSMNTEDKLFCDGKDTFLKWLDFTSIHYQPMGAFPALIKEWVERKSPYGPVRVWDTESWIANSEEHVSAVLAVMRAQGQLRTAGVLHDWTYTVTPTDVIQPDGTKKKTIVAVPWANAAAIAANQQLVGERTFREILFKNGVPWVFVFNGLPAVAESGITPKAIGMNSGPSNPDDGALVIVGDIGGNTERERCHFRTVCGLKQIERVTQLRAELAALPADTPQRTREKLKRDLATAQYLDGASLTITDEQGVFRAYDYFANPIPAKDGKITIPLNISGYFLRTDGSAGSFAKLIDAVKTAKLEGYQPVELVAHDLLGRIEQKPSLRLSITNVLNRPIVGKLTVALGELSIDAPAELKLGANETRELQIPIVKGDPSPSNSYALKVAFDAGADGRASLAEDIHVNVIAKKTISVDGDLKDWEKVLPQSVSPHSATAANVTEKAWKPWEKFEEGAPKGFATAYMAYDEQYFYFAAKIVDDTPFDGGIRYANRNDDEYFYPEKAYLVEKHGNEVKRKELVWPAGVRRYSYRKDPAIPSGAGTDNVQIAFGVYEPGQNGVLANPPGTMPRFMTWQCTDYEYAFNQVGEKYGGGTEIWRLFAPGVPRKHFYPRQPKADVDGGPVTDGKLVMKREGNLRIVEAALPWSELKDVKKRLDAGEKVRFNFRVNDNKGPSSELAANRSCSQMNSYAMHNFWEGHWSNELEFGFEK